eukprot:TRINITY_DN122_c0_g1_i1.p1 TRINITY_DN122_c0_g1~~TRINITY_DN122_c0_g1_i1.p1  ORF type:complete len:451 (-),score=92.68 TRINITY_DN122_c0_g1_i1:2071-3423(-)
MSKNGPLQRAIRTGFNPWLVSSRHGSSFILPTREKILKEHWKKRQREYIQNLKIATAVAGVVSSGVAYFWWQDKKRKARIGVENVEIASTSQAMASKSQRLTAREKRFLQFSSVEYGGRVYMTPRDFLESIVESEPRPRLKRKILTLDEVEEDLKRVPKLNTYKENLFRTMGKKGLISYSEYLFLLTILLKSQSGFKIAFSMLDQDGNKRIDREEFKVMETVFSSINKKETPEGEEPSEDNNIFYSHEDVSTLLETYFFGRSGEGELRLEDFNAFMDNIQTEVLQMEFFEYSKGTENINELDFARTLLRYTRLEQEEYQNTLERFYNRLQVHDVQGITFQEFRDFSRFLNQMDDFQIAMRMYTLADKAITEEEFTRTVYICTGQVISAYITKIIFLLFDTDGDGLLSYKEFIAMMQDRVHRGLNRSSKNESIYQGIKKCIQGEILDMGAA